jgi:hypothetical protein
MVQNWNNYESNVEVTCAIYEVNVIRINDVYARSRRLFWDNLKIQKDVSP